MRRNHGSAPVSMSGLQHAQVGNGLLPPDVLADALRACFGSPPLMEPDAIEAPGKPRAVTRHQTQNSDLSSGASLSNSACREAALELSCSFASLLFAAAWSLASSARSFASSAAMVAACSGSLFSSASVAFVLICFSRAAIRAEEEVELMLLDKSCVVCDVPEMALTMAHFPDDVD